jgi:hypothetical protein
VVALLLRKIRKGRWYKEHQPSWLCTDDIPADPLGDLVTRENRLSLWYIDDDKANLQDVVAAMAANADNVSNFDYALLDLEAVLSLGLKVASTEGGSPNKDANSRWHRDVIELSSSKLGQLAKLFYQKGQRGRVQERKVRKMILTSLDRGDKIDKSKLSSSMIHSLRLDQN